MSPAKSSGVSVGPVISFPLPSCGRWGSMPRLIVGTNWFPIKTAGRLLPVVGLTFVWNTIRDQLGARIVKTCEHSMVIRGTATDWQQWTGLRFRRVGITWCLALCLPWS